MKTRTVIYHRGHAYSPDELRLRARKLEIRKMCVNGTERRELQQEVDEILKLRKGLVKAEDVTTRLGLNRERQQRPSPYKMGVTK